MAPEQAPNVTYQALGERGRVLGPNGKELIALNPVGARVWEALGRDGQAAAAVVATLLPKFRASSRPGLAQEVEAFLSELAELGLVVTSDPSS